METRDVVSIAVAVGLYLGLRWLCGKRQGTVSDPRNKAVLWLSIAVAAGLIFGTPYWGTKAPGAVFEQDEYEGVFYVHLYPEGQRVSFYQVPARIRASRSYPDDSRYYHIHSAVMPDGRKITFENADMSLWPGTMVSMLDDAGALWQVMLTGTPVSP